MANEKDFRGLPGPRIPPAAAADVLLQSEIVTLRINVCHSANGLPRLELSAADGAAELAIERLSQALEGSRAAHQRYRRSRHYGGRIDRLSVICLPERRRNPRYNS